MIQLALKKIIFLTCISQGGFSVLFLKYTLVAALAAPETHQILPPLSFKCGGCVKTSNALTL